MSVRSSRFGDHHGKRVDQFHLTSETGVEVDIISFGVTTRDWRVPVKNGMRSVVLGFESFAPYPNHGQHLGAIAGRVANRISGAQFSVDGVSFALPANKAPNCLHGGPEGLGMQVWDGAIESARNGVRFTHFSPDGAMGFPGNVEFSALYTLSANKLRLELSASTDQATPISLLQHHYFNLGSGDDVIDHRYRFAASHFTESDAALLPTGRILPVENTLWDFRQAKTLRSATGRPIAYDGNLVLDAGRDFSEPVAVVNGPDGVLTLQLWTDRIGMQFYNAVTTNIGAPGLGGKYYGPFSGFCLEDQALPNAVNEPGFPSVIATPDRPYSHWCEIEIG